MGVNDNRNGVECGASTSYFCRTKILLVLQKLVGQFNFVAAARRALTNDVQAIMDSPADRVAIQCLYYSSPKSQRDDDY
jgi:hypothetical protein